MSRVTRKIGRWFKRQFAPWQDRDKVRAEVRAVRRLAPRLAWKPPDNPRLKWVEETQVEWIKRRDGK